MLTALFTALLCLPAGAQTITTINEDLATSSNTFYFDTNKPQLVVGTAVYAGAVPGVALFVSSNVVVSSATGGAAGCVIYSSGSLSCSGPVAGSNVPISSGPFVLKTGDTMTGALLGSGIDTGTVVSASLYGDGNNGTPLGVLSSSVVVREANSGIRIASATITGTGSSVYDLTLSSGVQFLTAKTGIVWQDGTVSTTASSGGGGSGVASSMTITAVSDNFLSQVTGSKTSFTLSQAPANAAALTCVLDGLLLSQTSDYVYTAPSTVAVTTAPAVNSASFFCNYFVNTSTLPAAFILNSTQTVSGQDTYSQAQTFSTFTYQASNWLGAAATWISTATGTSGVEVTSVDGAAQAYGCVVVMWWNATTGKFVESSTTTDMGSLSGVVSGVIYENCAPNTTCKIQTRGLVYLQTQSNTLLSNAVGTSSGRCLNGNNAYTSGAAYCGNNVCSGHMLESQGGSAGASAHAWMTGP